MKKILIISSSIRTGRKSHRVALYFQKLLTEAGHAPQLADLKTINLPLLNERLRYLEDPPQNLVDFAAMVKGAEGIIIVTPEYNGGIPPALKNAIDALLTEWQDKPVALCAVSGGSFGGSQVLTSLVFTLWKMGVWLVPASFQVPKISEAFNEQGEPLDPENTGKRAENFLQKFYKHLSMKP